MTVWNFNVSSGFLASIVHLQVLQAVMKGFHNGAINIFQEKWIAIPWELKQFSIQETQTLSEKQVKNLFLCAEFTRLCSVPNHFSFVTHLLSSSLPLSAVVLQSWMTSKMSPPSSISHAPPAIYKQISMSNQDHSLSPHASYWKKKKKELVSIPTGFSYNSTHSLTALECKLKTQWIGSKHFKQRRQLSLARSHWFPVRLPSRLAD